MLEISGTGAATEERIVAIEKKLRDMEALVKGLTQELLDLKSIAMKMSKQSEERSRQELKRVQAVAQDAPPQPVATSAASGSSSTVVMRKGARPSDAPLLQHLDERCLGEAGRGLGEMLLSEKCDEFKLIVLL